MARGRRHDRRVDERMAHRLMVSRVFGQPLTKRGYQDLCGALGGNPKRANRGNRSFRRRVLADLPRWAP